MNYTIFRDQLSSLNTQQLTDVKNGQGLDMVDDERLAVGPVGGNHQITLPEFDEVDDLLAASDDILDGYYRTHPLSHVGFHKQLGALVEEHGLHAFASQPGDLPARTLFVDGGELVAEGPDTPRFRYGICLELERTLAVSAVNDAVQHWISSNGAYEQYISTNVCRYGC